jgi:predicted enzyme related to lactoylglutathione lyase
VWLFASTPDVAVANSFYGRLFGWTTQPSAMGLTVYSADGKVIGTLMTHINIGSSTRPGWLPFVRVTDVDRSTARAVASGGKILVAPQSIDHVRVSVVLGVTGELIGLLQTPSTPGGRTLLGDTGVCAWFELATPEPDKAQVFYRKLFGWRIANEGGYTFISSESGQFGGIVKLTGDWDDHAFLSAIGRVRGDRRKTPPHWMVFFRTDDCDRLADDAEALGAIVTSRPEPLHTMGTFAVIRGPDGVLFSVLSQQ